MFNKLMAGLAILAQMLLFVPASAHADGTPIISAVQITGGEGATNNDFIELYNPAEEPFNLNGYRLVKRSAAGTTDSSIKSWSTDTFIPANSFYLWANSSYVIDPVADFSTSSTLADNNGIALRSGALDTGTIVDSLSWGTSSNAFTNVSVVNPGATESLSRVDLFDATAGYEIKPSVPRNSSVQLLPEPPVNDPPVEEPPTEEPPVEEPPVEDVPTPEPTPEPVQVRINEFLPNPTGEDSGLEKIELFNYGTVEADLTGWVLDDVSSTDPVSSNALTLSPATVPSGGYLTITIPEGKFAINNTGGDVITLFDIDGKAMDSAHFEGAAPENKSHSYFSSGWEWTEKTFGAVNIRPQEDSGEDGEEEEEVGPAEIIINEIYSFPGPGETEFVELYNEGDESIQLKNIVLWVGDKHKTLPDIILKSEEYFIAEGKDLPGALRNTGQKLKLFNVGELTDSVEYPKSSKALSYSKFENDFLWSRKVTKGKANVLEVPEDKKSEVALATTGPKASASTKKAPVVKRDTASATPAPLNTETPETAETISIPVASESPQKTVVNNKWHVPILVAAGLATVGGGMWLLYKYAFQEQADFV